MACWTLIATPEPDWALSPRCLELEQGGFLELEDCARLALEEEDPDE